ncbi:hypothetical protein P9112_013998 [Eukaryota sp. TZLM1-RC]
MIHAVHCLLIWLLVLLFCTTVSTTTHHWNSCSSGNWADHANWDLSSVPSPESTVIFPSSCGSPITIAIDEDVYIRNLELPPFVSLSFHTCYTFNISGTLHWTGGSFSSSSLPCSTIIESSGDLSITEPVDHTLDNHVLHLLGNGDIITGSVNLVSASEFIIDTHASLTITSQNSLYAWGANDKGQLGDGSITNRNEPVRVGVTGDIVDISAGLSHSLALLSNGDLLSWGCHGSGQGGHGSGDSYYTSPTLITNVNASFTTIFAGMDHSLALDTDNQVYTWGANDNGQLGLGHRDNVEFPTIVTVGGTPLLAKAIVGGHSHSAVIDLEGTVFTVGNNQNGRLGREGAGSGTTVFESITISDGTIPAVRMSAGASNTLVILENGDVYGWGSNSGGYLALGSTSNTINQPTYSSALTELGITEMSPGDDHYIYLAMDGTARTAGSNWYGQIGNGNTESSVSDLHQVSLPNLVIRVGATAQASYAVDIEGFVHIWGRISGSLQYLEPHQFFQAHGSNFIVSAGSYHFFTYSIGGFASFTGDNGQLTVDGTLNVFSPGVFVIENNAFIDGTVTIFDDDIYFKGPVEVTGDVAVQGNSKVIIENNFDINAGGKLTGHSIINVNGNDAQLTTLGEVDFTGKIIVENAGILNLLGFNTLTIGNIDVYNGKVNVEANLDNLLNLWLREDSEVNFSSPFVININNLYIWDGTRSGSSNITISSLCHWTGGLLTSTTKSSTLVLGSLLLDHSSESPLPTVSRTIDNHDLLLLGNGEWARDNLILDNESSFSVVSGSILDIRNTDSLELIQLDDGSVFFIEGTLSKTETASFTLNAYLHSTGLLSLEAGIFDLNHHSRATAGDVVVQTPCQLVVSDHFIIDSLSSFNSQSDVLLANLDSHLEVRGSFACSEKVLLDLGLAEFTSFSYFNGTFSLESGSLHINQNSHAHLLEVLIEGEGILTITDDAQIDEFASLSIINGNAEIKGSADVTFGDVSLSNSGHVDVSQNANVLFQNSQLSLSDSSQLAVSLGVDIGVKFADIELLNSAIFRINDASAGEFTIDSLKLLHDSIFDVSFDNSAVATISNFFHFHGTRSGDVDIHVSNLYHWTGGLLTSRSIVSTTLVTGNAAFGVDRISPSKERSIVSHELRISGNLDWNLLDLSIHQGKFVLEEDSIAHISIQELFTWGLNDYGQLGTGDYTAHSSPTVLTIPGLVLSIVGGSSHSLALLDSGFLYAWGDNTFGQNGLGFSSLSPQPLPLFAPVVKVVSGLDHNLAISDIGELWVWGRNVNGQLGLGDNVDRDVPTRVNLVGFDSVFDIATGDSHSVVSLNNGEVYSFGWGNGGQLGVGSYDDHYSPVLVDSYSNPVQVSAGSGHSVFLTVDGSVIAMGSNDQGQLGIGSSFIESTTPIQISSLSDVVQVFCGHFHTLALNDQGEVYAWGRNIEGQLGIGSFENSYVPVIVSSISGIVEVSAHAYQSFATRSDRRVYSWGLDSAGSVQETPVIELHGHALFVGGGTQHSFAITQGEKTSLLGINSESYFINNGYLSITAPNGFYFDVASFSDGYLKLITGNTTILERAVVETGTVEVDTNGILHLESDLVLKGDGSLLGSSIIYLNYPFSFLNSSGFTNFTGIVELYDGSIEFCGDAIIEKVNIDVIGGVVTFKDHSLGLVNLQSFVGGTVSTLDYSNITFTNMYLENNAGFEAKGSSIVEFTGHLKLSDFGSLEITDSATLVANSVLWELIDNSRVEIKQSAVTNLTSSDLKLTDSSIFVIESSASVFELATLWLLNNAKFDASCNNDISITNFYHFDGTRTGKTDIQTTYYHWTGGKLTFKDSFSSTFVNGEALFDDSPINSYTSTKERAIYNHELVLKGTATWNSKDIYLESDAVFNVHNDGVFTVDSSSDVEVINNANDDSLFVNHGVVNKEKDNVFTINSLFHNNGDFNLVSGEVVTNSPSNLFNGIFTLSSDTKLLINSDFSVANTATITGNGDVVVSDTDSYFEVSGYYSVSGDLLVDNSRIVVFNSNSSITEANLEIIDGSVYFTDNSISNDLDFKLSSGLIEINDSVIIEYISNLSMDAGQLNLLNSAKINQIDRLETHSTAEITLTDDSKVSLTDSIIELNDDSILLSNENSTITAVNTEVYLEEDSQFILDDNQCSLSFSDFYLTFNSIFDASCNNDISITNFYHFDGTRTGKTDIQTTYYHWTGGKLTFKDSFSETFVNGEALFDDSPINSYTSTKERAIYNHELVLKGTATWNSKDIYLESDAVFNVHNDGVFTVDSSSDVEVINNANDDSLFVNHGVVNKEKDNVFTINSLFHNNGDFNLVSGEVVTNSPSNLFNGIFLL